MNSSRCQRGVVWFRSMSVCADWGVVSPARGALEDGWLWPMRHAAVLLRIWQTAASLRARSFNNTVQV